jgi:cytochrome c biogenesis protein CcmG, thiol:disulfide interchange protein DsbE
MNDDDSHRSRSVLGAPLAITAHPRYNGPSMIITNRARLGLGGLLLIAVGVTGFFLLRRAAPVPLELGDKAVDFTVPRLDGGEIALRNYRGHVVLVNFWATWCPPCIEETPSLEKFAEQVKPYGVDVIGVSVDQDPAALAKYIKDYHLTYPIGRDPSQALAWRYGTRLWPETYIIGRDGRVASKIISNTDWEDPRMISFVRELAEGSKQ